MRALVIGASGQVGAALLRVLRARGHEAVGTWAHEAFPGLVPLDFTDPAATERLVVDTRPDWVLCPAALSHVDYCEEHRTRLRANLHGPLAAAQARPRRRRLRLYPRLRLDGVDGPYAEDARPARSRLRQSKWEGSMRCWVRSSAPGVRTSGYTARAPGKNSPTSDPRLPERQGFRPAVDSA